MGNNEQQWETFLIFITRDEKNVLRQQFRQWIFLGVKPLEVRLPSEPGRLSLGELGSGYLVSKLCL